MCLCKRLFLIVIACFFTNHVKCQQEVLIEESSAIESFHSGVGGAVELPCDVTPALPNDSMGLVIWYKQGHDTPIYTYDKREGVTSHWSDPSTLSTRATFRTNAEPAVLLLTKLRAEDSGQYRCRVDFIRSPTKNTRLNLTILIPPERLLILDQEGDEIKGGVLGPYDEGTEVNLTCVAVGGRPPARVSWWKSHALLANSEARATVSFTLQRADYGSEVTCQAVTDPSIAPLSEILTIDVNLRPLWVRLLGGKRPLVAGRRAELVCQAVGARPSPNISWWKGGTRLTTVRETTSPDGNVTSSTLSFMPSIEDAGRVLSCRATQPALPRAVREDGFQLEVQHLPVVKLELGANLDASKVVEGSDVYLDCMVRANPWHTHVYFTHNGATVRGGGGIVVANQSLVLQHVSRRAAGAYVCVARNALGEGSSEPLHLDVKYSPTCKNTQPIPLRAARGETVEIDCELEANPQEAMTYQWWLNSTAHSKLELNTMAVHAQNNLGRYLYTVNTSADYGWVQCAGTNSVGRQEVPCLFNILPAEKPSPVKSCTITNVTHESVSLACASGHDGGLRQAFLLQVFDMATGSLLRNMSSEEPQFAVWGLTGAVGMSVRAYNSKGSSEPFTLSSSLLKHPLRQTANVPVRVELTTILVTVLCTVAGIAAITTISAFIFCWKYCQKEEEKNEKAKRKQDEISNTPLTGNNDESVDSLDKNPDIIPIEGKINDNCSNKSSATDYSSIRPLLSKSDSDKYGNNCDRHCEHNEPCSQYVQVRPLDFRVHQYQHGLHMPNIGPSLNLGPNLSHIPNIGPNDCQAPYDKVYENWLKYKNSLPLNTSGLLPMEQCMPPELYPPSVYNTASRNPLNLAQMPELESYHAEPRSITQEYRGASPPVRVNPDSTSAYFSKNLLQRSAIGNPSRPDVESTMKSVETNTQQNDHRQECR
ncbi:B-cell receptor CD22-like [Nymphalis io]|uniref:B-cell receptor CD22-like n=1 Tax=Inachis io TaxID=171585 RepID=UPI00216A0A80|nr:B-cell receptor CD22-like [Nymphalis io]